MRKLLLLIPAALLFLVACEDDSSSPEGMADIQIYSDISNETVSSELAGKISQLMDSHVDSINVSEMRVLISRIKFHRTEKAVGEDNDFKAGPFLLRADSTGDAYTIAEGTVPEGSYDKIKFELHRFSGSEVDEFDGDPVFGDFATNDRYSVIIEGTYYSGGEETAFIFNGDVTANLSLNFEPAVELTDDDENPITLEFDPVSLFMDNGTLMTPTNENENEIEKNIKDAIKAYKGRQTQ